MQIKIVDDRLTPSMLAPANEGDAGIDMYACVHNQVKLFPNEIRKIRTGIKVAIPEGWVGLLIPRSSTGSAGLHLANTVGVIDSVYRGEVLMKVKNRSDDDHKMLMFEPMARIGQLVVVPHYEYKKMVFVDGELPETVRGDGGFGSTGE